MTVRSTATATGTRPAGATATATRPADMAPRGRRRCRPGPRALVSIAALATTGAVAVAGAVTAVPAGASSKATTITATETDFHIALSKKPTSPGKYTFVAKNKGQTTHGLEITGPGLSNAETKLISPGQSTKLTVTLKNGAYDVFCPVPGHKMLGMNVNLTIGGGSSAATTKATTSGSGGGGGNSYGY